MDVSAFWPTEGATSWFCSWETWPWPAGKQEVRLAFSVLLSQLQMQLQLLFFRWKCRWVGKLSGASPWDAFLIVFQLTLGSPCSFLSVWQLILFSCCPLSKPVHKFSIMWVRAGKYIYAFLNAWQLIILAGSLRKLAHINLQLSADKNPVSKDAGVALRSFRPLFQSWKGHSCPWFALQLIHQHGAPLTFETKVLTNFTFHLGGGTRSQFKLTLS